MKKIYALMLLTSLIARRTAKAIGQAPLELGVVTEEAISLINQTPDTLDVTVGVHSYEGEPAKNLKHIKIDPYERKKIKYKRKKLTFDIYKVSAAIEGNENRASTSISPNDKNFYVEKVDYVTPGIIIKQRSPSPIRSRTPSPMP